MTGQTSCGDADPGHYVGLPGQFVQLECLAGTYQPSGGESSCIDASIGFYVLLNGAVEQTACPYQTSTIEIGSKLMSDCLIDTDFDLLPDVTDPDDDADGTLDITDAFPLDASEDKDSDGDGRGDNMQKLAEAKLMRMILIAVVLLLVTASIIGTFMMRSRKEDEVSDWHKEDYLFDEVDHMKQPQIPPQPTPSPQPTIPPMENKIDYVGTWQELPIGHWLEYDENGTNWYKANDGTHWYSSEGGYRLWKDNR